MINLLILNAKDVDIVSPMYNLIEFSNNYVKTSRSLWQCYKKEPNNNVVDSKSFKSKVKASGSAPTKGNTKGFETIVPLKYLSNFWRTLAMSLINCEVNLILTWLSTCHATNSASVGKFEKANKYLVFQL